MFAGLVATEACTTMHLQGPPPEEISQLSKNVEKVIQLLSISAHHGSSWRME